jgi:hypothetical protein
MAIYPLIEKDVVRLENNFMYHAPLNGQAEKYTEIREMAKHFAYALVSLCPPSRELSLALTDLENAVMWANAAIARNETEEEIK